MKPGKNVKRSLLSIVGVMAISTIVSGPVVAQNEVEQEIIGGGPLAAFVADATMDQFTYSNIAGSTTGELILQVDDPRGTSVGWSVSIQSSDFIWAGTTNANALDIPVAGFAITSVGDPVMVAGQAVGPGGPRAETAAVASLATSRTPISASAGSGSGVYTQSLPVSLDIPARSQVGIYTATLTVLVAAAP